MSSPPPRRRLTFKRLLLALVLGLAAWWAVGWWLSPRPLYVLKYPELGYLTPDGASEELPDIGFDVFPNGSVLLVQRPNYPRPGLVTLERRDLSSGSIIREEKLSVGKYSQLNAAPRGGRLLLDTTDAQAARLVWPGQHVSFRGDPNHFEFLGVEGTSQEVRELEDRFSLGAVLDGLLSQLPWEITWRSSGTTRAGVWDTESRAFLWSIPLRYGSESNVRIKSTQAENFVFFDELANGEHVVSALKLPLTPWSPWWSRSAGLLVAALVLFAPRRRPVTSK